MITLEDITDKIEILNYTNWIVSTELEIGTHAELIGNVLLGHLKALKGIKNNEVVGLCIYNVNLPNCFINFVYCKTDFMLFQQKFFALCNLHGIKRIQATSMHSDKVFTRLTSMVKKYSVFEKEL